MCDHDSNTIQYCSDIVHHLKSDRQMVKSDRQMAFELMCGLAAFGSKRYAYRLSVSFEEGR